MHGLGTLSKTFWPAWGRQRPLGSAVQRAVSRPAPPRSRLHDLGLLASCLRALLSSSLPWWVTCMGVSSPNIFVSGRAGMKGARRVLSTGWPSCSVLCSKWPSLPLGREKRSDLSKEKLSGPVAVLPAEVTGRPVTAGQWREDPTQLVVEWMAAEALYPVASCLGRMQGLETPGCHHHPLVHRDAWLLCTGVQVQTGQTKIP